MAESTPTHPLQTEWAFWYDDHKKSSDFKEYQQGLQKLSAFNTVEGFWGSFSHIAKPDTFPRECSVYLTRESATPAWETFPQGGCWLIRVRKKNSLVDRLWEELVFASIAELFELPDIVCVGVTTRLREDVLSIWNDDNSNPDTRFIIGEKLRSLLNLDETTNVEYKTFKSSIKDKSSFKNTREYGYIAPPQLKPPTTGSQGRQPRDNTKPPTSNNNFANKPTKPAQTTPKKPETDADADAISTSSVPNPETQR